MITKPQPYEEVFDKAGVRIVPTYPDDRDAVAEVVEKAFIVTWRKDFSEVTDVRLFDYRGLHFTVGLQEQDRADTPSELKAELQVHRPGEALWATINHDLFYKSRLKSWPMLRRSMQRLSALLELVDSEMATIRTQLLQGPDARATEIVDAIEVDFLRLCGRTFDEDLTMLIVRALAPAAGDNVAAFLAGYREFVTTQNPKLEHVFTDYRDDFRHLLLSQPESILIFYLSEFAKPELEKHWPPEVPETMLDGLADIWIPSS
jgi:hypothetical protein